LTQNNTTVNLTTNTSLAEVLRAIKDSESLESIEQSTIIDI
jgi:hypothetical protein